MPAPSATNSLLPSALVRMRNYPPGRSQWDADAVYPDRLAIVAYNRFVVGINE